MNAIPPKFQKVQARQPRKRSCDRLNVSVIVRGRSPDGNSFQMRLKDLSNYGCSGSGILSVQPGEQIEIELGALGFLPAIVKWRSSITFGLEFARPLAWRELLPFLSQAKLKAGVEDEVQSTR